MNQMQIAEKAIKQIETAGFEAYMVGGCVRDRLRGAEPGDFDLTTSAEPDQIMEIFREHKVFTVGARHGTITVIIDGVPLEITTYRTEEGYSDNRRPDQVHFTKNLREDLSRRDFTINAIAYAPGKPLHDYFGGQQDLEHGIVRAIGAAQLRFEEDALRILRALRFASVLDFHIEEETRKAIFSEKERLKSISKERIWQELLKLLMGDGVRRILMEYVDVLGVVIPELLLIKNFPQDNGYHVYDVWEHTAAVVEETPKTEYLRAAALLHDIGKPEYHRKDEQGRDCFFGHGAGSKRLADRVLRELKAPTDFRRYVVCLIEYHDIYLHADKKELKRWLQKIGPEMVMDLIELKKADNRGQNIQQYDGQQKLEEIKRMVISILENKECYSLAQLEINGNDLKNLLGIEGPKIGESLHRILEAVIDGKVENRRESLLKFAKSL